MNLALQITVFLLMAIVGLDLARADFGRLTDRPALVIAATIGQVTVLPMVLGAIAAANRWRRNSYQLTR